VRLSLLGSGSSGNVAYVEAGEASARTRVLVDAGLHRTAIEERLVEVGHANRSGPLTLAQIDAVLVTHDHGDHVGCASSLGRPLYATAGTRRACSLEATLVRAGQRFHVGALEVLPVLLPHDAEETVGYVISDGSARIGIITDCGYDAPEVAAAYAGCQVLALEANYDPTLLKLGPYPFSLKRRVGGQRGHLSNEQSASLLRQICRLGPPPQLVLAAHVSQANNRPQLAKSALDRALGRGGRVLVATQGRPTPVITVDNGVVTTGPLVREQLSFAFARGALALDPIAHKA
jgi:phosphoribosyl 1,2-cyclic phosphodiesterase